MGSITDEDLNDLKISLDEISRNMDKLSAKLYLSYREKYLRF